MTAVLLALLVGLPASAGLNERELMWRQLKLGYSLTFSGEAFVRALARHENGPAGFEMGHGQCGRQHVAAHPFVSPEHLQFAKATVAYIEALQAYAYSTPWHRREFCRFFARFYHACDGEEDAKKCAAKNDAYGRLQNVLWSEERDKLEAVREVTGWHPLDEEERMAANREAAHR